MFIWSGNRRLDRFYVDFVSKTVPVCRTVIFVAVGDLRISSNLLCTGIVSPQNLMRLV